MPTADGTANQILVTNGSNVLSFANQQDISVKTDNTTFNAHVAQAMVTTGSNAPALDNTYDLGNNSNKYNEIFSTYFRGTADLAVNATNLGSQPAANYRLAADSYTKAEVDSAISSGGSDSQDLTISGNVISLTGQTGNVDLTSTLAGVAGNYGDSNVATYLTNNSYATQTFVNTSNTNVVAYVDSQVTLLKGGANVNLDSLAEVANALNNSLSLIHI